jgi:GT2 family glycosyltransferase
MSARPGSNENEPVQVSIVIVAWNAKNFVIECLESLAYLRGKLSFEVIVVDNASTDGAPESVEQLFPDVKLIRNDGNYGFAQANNIGIKRSRGSYLALVNSDARFVDNCFEPMLNYMAEHPDIGLLGPKMLGPEGTYGRSTIRFPTVWNTFCRAMNVDVFFKGWKLFNSYITFEFKHNETRDVETLAGWFWLVRRSALEKVGLLDERFFMYGEDFDWCYRFHQKGERVVFFAGAQAFHYGGASSSAAPPEFTVEQERSNGQFFRKHYGIASRIGVFLTSVLNHAIRLVGHGLLIVVKPADREDSIKKFHRSAACLSLLFRTGV